MAVDPICKMDVEEKSAKWVSEYKDKKYYFCAQDVKKNSMKILKNMQNKQIFTPLF